MLNMDGKDVAKAEARLHLLSLPYDVRHTIYSHLFPSLRQIYLMASKESINPMMRPGSLNTHIFLTCRQLQAEASDYLFNNYLFNIFGHKKHCVAHYKPVYKLMVRYAKRGAKIEILDNGTLSTTACVSIHAKSRHVEAMLRGRERGVPRDLKEFEDEAAQLPDLDNGQSRNNRGPLSARLIDYIAFMKMQFDITIKPALIPSMLIVALAVLLHMLYNYFISEAA